MTSTDPATLHYVHDPMCSWCWGFRPTWQQLRRHLPDELRLISRVGGLAADSDQPMPESMRLSLQQTWRRIAEQIPGTEFNFGFWNRNTPRRSTYPACRAVIAARELGGDTEGEALADAMTSGIQQAYYLQARNPSDLETLSAIAEDIGLDRAAFESLMSSPRIHELLAQELGEVRALGIDSFPSLLIEQGEQRARIPVDYLSAERMQQQIEAFLANPAQVAAELWTPR